MIRQTGHGKLNILIFADYYLPGFKAGGPIKTLSNLVDQLGDEFHFISLRQYSLQIVKVISGNSSGRKLKIHR